jgi:hypothetical protein
MRENSSLVSLNRGIISRLGIARVDVKRLSLAAEDMTNWMPRVLGPMSLRPGLGYKLSVYNHEPCRYLRFIFATDDTALLELTPLVMRVVIDDTVLTRPAVTSAVANGSFTSNLTSWTDNDDAGAASTWVAPGYMQLVGTGEARAIRDQVVTTVETGVEHALRIVVARGPVQIRVGTTAGADEYVEETTLETGEHSLAFTPTGDFNIRFFSTELRKVWVNSCTVEAAGVVTIPTPWDEDDLQYVRTDQSADVLFVACAGMQQRRIERRGTGRSWSVALYPPIDGPFDIENTGPITLTPSALSGNITVTASLPLFRAEHVGGLFSLTSVGQEVTTVGASSGVFTDSIRVTGQSTDGFVGSQRTFSVVIEGNASGSTVDLQRSYDDSTWATIGGGSSWTSNVTTTITDELDNQVVYYRLILTTRVAPDSVTMTLRIGSGSIRGVFRVTDYTNSTTVGAEVVVSLGGLTANAVWQEGLWSDKRGWPTAVGFHEGRLWWAGINGIWGSVSDAYDSFDETFEGDAGPLNRTIGSGPVDTINFLLSMRGLLIGAQGAEISARSSSLDEPLTPTNFNLKTPTTQGSAAVEALKIDQRGYFVHRSGVKVFELSFDVGSYDYKSQDLMALVPELGVPGIVRIDVQRQPDTRIHCVRSDGTAIVAVIDRVEEVLAWVPVETDGLIEDVVILPALDGDIDDQVYYVVKRTIGGSTVRYLEKWAQESDCRGGASNQQADSFITFSSPGTEILTGLGHLEGEEVVVWADGVDLGTDDSARPWTQTYTVSGGAITLPSIPTQAVVGLGYSAPFKSAKLGQLTSAGSPLNKHKKVGDIGLILADTHPRGLRFGPDFDHLDDMPSVEAGAPVDTSVVHEAYDEEAIPFPGTWTTDSRVCIQAQAPRPATVLAITTDLETH